MMSRLKAIRVTNNDEHVEEHCTQECADVDVSVQDEYAVCADER